MDKLEIYLKIAVSVMAIIVPCILLAGYSFHLGHVMTFDLDETLISKSMSEVLIESWYVSILLLVWVIKNWTPWAVYLGILLLIALGIFFFFRYANEKGMEWVFEEITKENQGRKVLGMTQWHWMSVWQIINLFARPVAYLLLLFSAISSLTAIPYGIGEELSNKQINLYQKFGCDNESELTCIVLINIENEQQVEMAKGILVASNNKRIAIFNNKHEVWPLLDSYIISKSKVIKNDASTAD